MKKTDKQAEATASQTPTELTSGSANLNQGYSILTQFELIEVEIKDPSKITEAYAKLLTIEAENNLTPEEEFKFLFIRGKYFTKKYRNSHNKQIALLEIADDWFEEAHKLAKAENLTIPLNVHFLRAHTKYTIGINHKNKSVRDRFLKKAKYLTETSLKYHPDNESFIWLQTEINKLNPAL